MLEFLLLTIGYGVFSFIGSFGLAIYGGNKRIRELTALANRGAPRLDRDKTDKPGEDKYRPER